MVIYEWEADPRLAGGIKESYEKGTKEVLFKYSTPGEKGCEKKAGFHKEITEQEHRMYRSMVQRAIFLSQDHPDIMFAAKGLARWASKPTMGHFHQMKRLAGI